MGAWIETIISLAIEFAISKSHPTWVRGLKHEVVELDEIKTCRTLRGCVD